jgi:xeroderma pigmentosum group C-complementing protein
MTTQSKTTSTYDFASDSEDEFDWEEVAVPQARQSELADPRDDDEAEQGSSTRPNIEITLEAHPTRAKDGTQYEVVSSFSQTGELKSP